MGLTPEIFTVRKATPEFPRHSETGLVECGDGSLLMVWQEYTRSEHKGEDNAPNRLPSMRSRDGGRTWGEHRILVETAPGNTNVYSPNLLRLPDGDILFLYFTYHNLAPGQRVLSSAFVRRSQDDGVTFGTPIPIWTRQPLTFPSGVIKRMPTGRLIVPLDECVGEIWSKTDHFAAGAMTSDDGGNTWQIHPRSVDLPLRGVMEPHVEPLKDGTVLMVMRTQLGAVFQSHSADGGVTWSKPQTTGLHAPESCPEFVRIPSTGDLALVWNSSEYDAKFGSHYGKRSPLSVAVSIDEGRTWSIPRHVETDPTWAFSNPGLYFYGKGQAILLYWACTYNTDRWTMCVDLVDLKAAIFPVSWMYE